MVFWPTVRPPGHDTLSLKISSEKYIGHLYEEKNKSGMTSPDRPSTQIRKERNIAWFRKSNLFLSCQFLRSYLNSTKAPLRHPIWAEPFQQSWADEATRTTRISRNAVRYLRVLVGLALRATRAPKLTGRPGFPWYLE